MSKNFPSPETTREELDETLRALFEQTLRQGQSPTTFGPLGALAAVFHLDFALWRQLVDDGETIKIFDELDAAVFPFDAFELRLTNAPEMPFRDAGLSDAYQSAGYLLAMRRETNKATFLIADELYIRNDKDATPKIMISAGFYTLIPAQTDETDAQILFTPIMPQSVPINPTITTKIAAEEKQTTYWLRLLATFIRFARLLNHRGVAIQRFEDPQRPPTRQQRRAAGYADREHHRIALRPRLTVVTAIQDVLSGRSLRYTPRRRHAVHEFSRTYASGKPAPSARTYAAAAFPPASITMRGPSSAMQFQKYQRDKRFPFLSG